MATLFKDRNWSGQEDWMPQEVRNLLNCDNIQIFTLNQIDRNQVKQDLLRSRHVGLTVISEERRLVVGLTSIDKIFVCLLWVESDVDFLRQVMADKRIHLYTVDGSKDADLLYRATSIRLVGGPNLTDLTAFDQYLKTSGDYLDKNHKQMSFFDSDYVRHSLRPYARDYSLLVDSWLGLEARVIRCSPEELEAVKLLPELSLMAGNAIKKCSALVRCLALEMLKVYHSRFRRPSSIIFSYALLNDNLKGSLENKGDISYAELASL